MSENIPWWGKLVLYGSLAIGSLIVIGYAITTYLLGPINTYKDMWNKQYQALLAKMANYQMSNPNGWTTAQKQNVAEENSILAQTTQGLATASKGITDLGTQIIEGLAAVGITYVIASKVVAYLKSRSSGQVRTAQAASYAGVMSFADYLAENGFPTQATNLISTAQVMFQVYDQPYMQQTIINLQNSLPSLTGVDLIVAQQMIEALNIEITAIPLLLIAPLPIV